MTAATRSAFAATGTAPVPLAVSEYELHATPIGHGSESVFYLAQHARTQQFVALKCLDLDSARAQLDRVHAELAVWRAFAHPCLQPCLAAFVSDTQLFMLTPLMSGGSLLGMLSLYFLDGLEEDVVATVMREVLKGLAYVHAQGFVHGAVRAEHILVENDGSVRLSGVHKALRLPSPPYELGYHRRELFDFRGEFEWMAPEIMAQDLGYDAKADTYSVGITIFELIHGVTPYHEWPPLQILLNKLDSALPPLDNSKPGLSKHFFKLLGRCLDKDPARRPSALAMLQDAFLRNAKDKHYLSVCLIDRCAIMRDATERAAALTATSATAAAAAQDEAVADEDAADAPPDEPERSPPVFNF